MNKHTKEYTSLIFKAVLSGIMISVGGAVYLLCENKIMGSFLFSFGLFTIVQRGFALLNNISDMKKADPSTLSLEQEA